MPNRQYSYQYETSPRKINPEYNKPKKKKPTPKKTQAKKMEKNTVQAGKKQKEDLRAKKKLVLKTKFSIFIKSILLFAILFFIIFMNSRISESFSEIQKLKTTISSLQKENDQLEINIQNSVNLNRIEQLAKSLLGMQKLKNKQTAYISLSTKDYVEPRTENIIMDTEQSFWDKIIEKITNIF